MAVELADGYISLIPSAKGFTNKIQSELGSPLDDIGRDAGDRTSRGFVDRFSHGLSGIAVRVGAAFAAVQIGGFFKDSITEASGLGEQMNKVNVVFGDSAADIQEWAKTASKSLGQSQKGALAAAGTFGNLFTALKIGRPEAAKMSKSLVGLASDLASFNDVSPEEALEALRSGLVGETEPLKRFGVNMNEATLKLKAMELGLSDGKGVLDANAKAQAAYALIMEQTVVAQGDFVNTGDSLANIQRKIGAQFVDLKAKIGAEFLPAVTAIAKVISADVIPALVEFVEWVGPRAKLAIDAFKAAFSGGGITSDGFIGFVERAGVVTAVVVGIFKDDIPNAVKAFVDGFRDAGSGVDRSGVTGKLHDLGEKLRDLVDLVRRNDDIFKPIIAGLAGVGAAFVAISSATGILGVLGSLGGLLGGMAQILPLLISPVGLFALAVGALAAAAYLAYKNFTPFKAAVDSVVQVFRVNGFAAAVEEAGVQVGRLWDIVRPKLDEFIAKIGPWLEAHAPGILEGLKSAWVGFATFMGTEFFPFLAEKLGVLLAQLGGWIVDVAAPWLKDHLLVWARAFGDWVSESAWPWLRDKLPQLITDLGQWVIDNKPLIEAKLIEWGNAFADWVENEAMPKLQEKLPGILQTIADFIVGTVLPQLAIFAQNMAFALIQFAAQAAIQLPGELGRITVALATWAAQLTAQAHSLLFNAGLGIGRGLVSGIGSALGDIGSVLGGVGQRIVDAVIAPIRAAWNRLRFTIPSIDVPFFGKIGGISIGVTPLAAGGLVVSPTLALVGEAGPEIVSPVKMMQQVFRAELASAGGGSLPPLTININGAVGGQDELTRWIHGSLRQYEAARR